MTHHSAAGEASPSAEEERAPCVSWLSLCRGCRFLFGESSLTSLEVTGKKKKYSRAVQTCIDLPATPLLHEGPYLGYLGSKRSYQPVCPIQRILLQSSQTCTKLKALRGTLRDVNQTAVFVSDASLLRAVSSGCRVLEV